MKIVFLHSAHLALPTTTHARLPRPTTCHECRRDLHNVHAWSNHLPTNKFSDLQHMSRRADPPACLLYPANGFGRLWTAALNLTQPHAMCSRASCRIRNVSQAKNNCDGNYAAANGSAIISKSGGGYFTVHWKPLRAMHVHSNTATRRSRFPSYKRGAPPTTATRSLMVQRVVVWCPT